MDILMSNFLIGTMKFKSLVRFAPDCNWTSDAQVAAWPSSGHFRSFNEIRILVSSSSVCGWSKGVGEKTKLRHCLETLVLCVKVEKLQVGANVDPLFRSLTPIHTYGLLNSNVPIAFVRRSNWSYSCPLWHVSPVSSCIRENGAWPHLCLIRVATNTWENAFHRMQTYHTPHCLI